MSRFRFVTDDDGHNYIIPADRLDDWDTFLNSEAAKDGDVPIWAKNINAVHRWSFARPEEDR